VQRQDGDASGDPGKPLRRGGLDDDPFQVLRMELPELDEQDTAVLAPRRVARPRRIADVGAGRVFTQFVREGAVRTRNSSPSACS
jgi:hypothetical protein